MYDLFDTLFAEKLRDALVAHVKAVELQFAGCEGRRLDVDTDDTGYPVILFHEPQKARTDISGTPC
jgi:hypothetical protein